MNSAATNKTLVSTSSPSELSGKSTDLAVLIAVLTATFLLNFISAIVIWRLPGFEQNKYHLAVRTLVIADFLLPVPTLPLSIASYANRAWIGGHVSCVLSALFSNLLLGWSTSIVVIMCVLRYLAMTKPLFYRNCVTYPRLQKAIFGAFIWGGLHVIMPIIGLGKFRFYKKGMYCGLGLTPKSPRDRTLVYLVIGEGLLTIVALIYFCSAVILATLKKKKSVISHMSIQQQRGLAVSKTNKQHGGFAGMFLAIVILYCICFLPYLAYRIMVVGQSWSYYDSKSYFYTQIIAYVNPLLNPLVYVVCNKRYRKSLKDLLARSFACRCSSSVQPQRLRLVSDVYGLEPHMDVELRKLSCISTATKVVLLQ